MYEYCNGYWSSYVLWSLGSAMHSTTKPRKPRAHTAQAMMPGQDEWAMLRADVVAANNSILHSSSRVVMPALKSVELAVCARCDKSSGIVHVISEFVDASPRWTLVQAADAGLWRLVQRITLRDDFNSGDPFYRQWVFSKALARAAAADRLDMVQFLSAHFPGCYVTIAVEEAARHGHLRILQWFHAHHGCVKWGGDELCAALRNSRLEVAQWLHANVPRPRYSGSLKDAAAESGDVEVLSWIFAVDDSRVTGYFLQSLVDAGNLSAVEWVVEGGRIGPADSPAISLGNVASKGNLALVQWVIEHGIGQCSSYCAEKTAANGHDDVVMWLMQNRVDSWSDTSLNMIIGHSGLRLAQWLVENYKGRFTSRAMDLAAGHGHLDVVMFLHEEDFDCTNAAMNSAAENGHLEVVRWLHENRSEGCTVDAMDRAARNGHLDVVQWLHMHRSEGCTTEAMHYAARNGHLDVIKWLHENRSEGCTSTAMSAAAGNGHMDVLEWLDAHHYERCTPGALNPICSAGHLDIAKWVHNHCALEVSLKSLKWVLLAAAGKSRLETCRWLVATYNNIQRPDFAMDTVADVGHFPMMILLRSEFGCRCSGDAFINAGQANELEILQWLFLHFHEEVIDAPVVEYELCVSSPCVQNWLFSESGPFART